METHIAFLDGRGIHHVPHATRLRLHLEGDWGGVAINNFSNFGVDRTVSYYRPAAERVATSLNKTFFPGAKLEPAPWLAGRIVVKVVLGNDPGLINRPQPRGFMGRNSAGLSPPGTAPYTGFRLKPAHTWPGLCYNIDNWLT
jgi:hypothetical protein